MTNHGCSLEAMDRLRSDCYKLKRALHGCYAASMLGTHGALLTVESP